MMIRTSSKIMIVYQEKSIQRLNYQQCRSLKSWKSCINISFRLWPIRRISVRQANYKNIFYYVIKIHTMQVDHYQRLIPKLIESFHRQTNYFRQFLQIERSVIFQTDIDFFFSFFFFFFAFIRVRFFR